MWPTLNDFFSAKKTNKKTLLEVRPRDGHVEHVCKISGSVSLKNGVDIWIFYA